MMKRSQPASAILVPVLLAGASLGLFTPKPASAVRVPGPCSDLVEGDCGNPLQCIVFCLMEVSGVYDYCADHPESPLCQ